MPDLILMIGNLSQSFISLQSLITGFGYVFGCSLVLFGLVKCAGLAGHSRERMSVPVAYIFGGILLIFLPTSIDVFSTTLFGSTSALQYMEYNPYNLYSSMKILIQTAGLLWFVRGIALLINAAKPGEQHGPKGMAFVIAGICAINIEYTIGWVDAGITYLMNLLKGPL